MTEQIFLKVLNMSFSASVLVAVVLVLRLVLKKAPKWINVLLWGMVALRLLCPFTPESSLSLSPKPEIVTQELLLSRAPAIDSGIPAVDSLVNPILTEQFTPDPSVSANPLQILIGVSAYLWVLGMTLMGLYTLISYWRIHRRVATAVRIRENIFESEAVGSPFVLGLIKPRIYLPLHIMDADAEHVIAHERTHIRRKDHWWKPLGFLLLAVHWFNPLLWLAYSLLCRDIELACDERVVQALTDAQRADYSQSLLNCAVHRRQILACPLAFGEVGVKERVVSILNYKKPAFWVVLIALILCAVVAVCFLTEPEAAEGDSIDFSHLDADTLTQIELTNCHNGTVTSITDPNAIAQICRFLQTLSGTDAHSGKGYYEGSYSLHCYAGIEEVACIAFGDSDAFYCGEFDDGAAARYYLENQNISQVIGFLSAYDSSDFDWPEKVTAYWMPALIVHSASPTGAVIGFQCSPLLPEGALTTGSDYALQRKQGASWVDVEPLTEAIFTTEAIVVSENYRKTISFGSLYGTLPEGDYRIVKSVTCWIGEQVQHVTVYGEFSVKNLEPHAVTSAYTRDDVLWIQANTPTGHQVTLLEEGINELVTILNSLTEEDFHRQEDHSYDIRLTVESDSAPLLLRSDGILTHISFDLTSPEAIEHSCWTVRSEALANWLGDIAQMPYRIAPLAGQQYRVSEILYIHPDYAGVYEPGSRVPDYRITEDGALEARNELNSDGQWHLMGTPQVYEFTTRNFEANFVTPFDAEAIRSDNLYGWILRTHDPAQTHDVHYYLLQQRSGQLLLAYVLPGMGQSEVVWLMSLTPASETGVLYRDNVPGSLCIRMVPTEVGTGRYAVIPDQSAAMAAYDKAIAALQPGVGRRGDPDIGISIEYGNDYLYLAQSGAIYTFGGSISKEAASDLYALAVAAARACFWEESVAPGQIRNIRSATLNWYTPVTLTDPGKLETLERLLAASEYLPGGAGCPFGNLLTLELESGETLTLSMAADSCAAWLSNGVYYDFGSGNEEFYALFSSPVIHALAKDGWDAVGGLLTYLDWADYIAAWGQEDTFALMDLIGGHALENPDLGNLGAAMNLGLGTDGACTEYYAQILNRLYEANPKDFAWACLGNATEEVKENTRNLLAYSRSLTIAETQALLENQLPNP